MKIRQKDAERFYVWTEEYHTVITHIRVFCVPRPLVISDVIRLCFGKQLEQIANLVHVA